MAHVFLNGRNRGKTEAAAEMLREEGYDVGVAIFDVTDHEAVRSGMNDLVEEAGKTDILVNNAGMQFRSPLEEFPADRWEQLLKMNISRSGRPQRGT